MLLKKDDAETLTSDHRLLRDIPSFKPNAYTLKQENHQEAAERRLNIENKKAGKSKEKKGSDSRWSSMSQEMRRWKEELKLKAKVPAGHLCCLHFIMLQSMLDRVSVHTFVHFP
jgi:hypothetical protein